MVYGGGSSSGGSLQVVGVKCERPAEGEAIETQLGHKLTQRNRTEKVMGLQAHPDF